jgi:hypothetical protein
MRIIFESPMRRASSCSWAMSSRIRGCADLVVLSCLVDGHPAGKLALLYVPIRSPMRPDYVQMV